VRYSYTRLVADEQGESHFETIETELSPVDYAPPASPLHLSAFAPASQTGFLGAPADRDGRAWRPSPARQLFITLAGTLVLHLCLDLVPG
jgi:hypothetical protein